MQATDLELALILDASNTVGQAQRVFASLQHVRPAEKEEGLRSRRPDAPSIGTSETRRAHIHIAPMLTFAVVMRCQRDAMRQDVRARTSAFHKLGTRFFFHAKSHKAEMLFTQLVSNSMGRNEWHGYAGCCEGEDWSKSADGCSRRALLPGKLALSGRCKNEAEKRGRKTHLRPRGWTRHAVSGPMEIVMPSGCYVRGCSRRCAVVRSLSRTARRASGAC